MHPASTRDTVGRPYSACETIEQKERALVNREMDRVAHALVDRAAALLAY